MLNSNIRKLTLSGWLYANEPDVYCSPLKLQKFLFFYEAFCKVEGENYDFDRLRGYQRGPVFSQVLGDYAHEKELFSQAAQEEYNKHGQEIHENFARQSAFIVKVQSENELSQLTHQYHIWNAKAPRIMAGEQQVALYDSDFEKNDCELTKRLLAMYPDELIKGSFAYSVGGVYFVFSQEDAKKLEERHFDILALLAEKEHLQNPVFAEIDEEGRIVIID